MKLKVGDLLLDYEGDLYKVLSADSEANRYVIRDLLGQWEDRLDAEVLEQSFTKLPAGTIGELVHKLLDYPMDTPISIYRASGSVDLYLDSISDIEIDYEDTGGNHLMLEDGKFKHRFMVKLSDGTVEVFREGDAKDMRTNMAAFEQWKPRFLDGYNLDHVIKFWVETPEQQQQREQELLEAARRGVMVLDD